MPLIHYSIGKGTLDVTIPIAFPTLFEWYETLAYRIPRLWVDLIQRATGKIRWIPIVPAKVTLIRYDYTAYGGLNILGSKALIDALQYSATGRRDGMLLYYFGAIHDDDQEYMRQLHIRQELVDDPSLACTRIIVEPEDPQAEQVMTLTMSDAAIAGLRTEASCLDH